MRLYNFVIDCLTLFCIVLEIGTQHLILQLEGVVSSVNKYCITLLYAALPNSVVLYYTLQDAIIIVYMPF